MKRPSPRLRFGPVLLVPLCLAACADSRPAVIDAPVVDATSPADVSSDLDAATDATGMDNAVMAADTTVFDTVPRADVPWSRDWAASPAIVQLARPAALFAVSDVHGGYARLAALLARHGILASMPATPDAARWGAGDSDLVVVGDMIDKGPQALEVVDLLRALQIDAASSGGHVVVTLGNHEGEFLVDPLNSKATAADGVDPEITAM